MTPRETVIQVMTDTVTVRRDALRALVEVSVAYHGIPLVAPITEVYTRAVDDRLAAMSVSPWQPIETAPRDGTKILVFHPDMGVEITEWYEITQTNYVEFEGGLYRKERAIFYAGWNNNGHHATHWQPLPEPPK